VSEQQADAGALAGLRVLDLTSTFMGPYCTMLLSQWGADVVKVEPPEGDVVRYISDHRQTGMGPVFLNTNRGKRSLCVDLKTTAGHDVLERLIRRSDLVAHNLRAAAAVRLGLDPASVRAGNPSCVLLVFRGFGPGGPAAGDAAYDDVIQARSGLAALQGNGGEASYVRSSIADKAVGVFGAAAALAALHQRDRSGAGAVVEIPMFETMVGFNLLEQQGGMTFDPPVGPAGYSRTSSVYRRPYRTRDGYVSVMIYTDAQWRAFFDLIGKPESGTDPRFTTIRERTLHSDILYGTVDEAMLERTSAEWMAALAAHGIACGPVNTLDDLFTDPHLVATGFFHQVEHPTEGRLTLGSVTGPVGDGEHRWYAPRLGADGPDVLRELGYDSAGIDALRHAGVVTVPREAQAREAQAREAQNSA
jgi:crotonobetainyl-CoA:carnitine CoA-transferase CaiB-like acyl-CoA transferase